MLEDLDLSRVQDEYASECIVRLLTLAESLATDLCAAREEIQRLRDEINRLKGAQGKPKIKGNIPKPPTGNYSSERERQTPKAWTKGGKTAHIRIDREQLLRIDPATLPPDAKFKGYEDVAVQDVIFRTDNVLFRKEKYYSKAAGKSYLAELPRGYQGEFAPGVKSLTTVLYFGARMTEPKIAELFGSVGLLISEGQLSNLLIKDQGGFHAEKEALPRVTISTRSGPLPLNPR